VLRAPSRKAGAAGLLMVVALVASVTTACSSRGAANTRTGTLVWHSCGSIQCASLSVPLDWSHPKGEHITLALARRPADDRSDGVLLTNPGGPGGSGIDLVRDSSDSFGAPLRDHFDIVSWDPRGVGQSTPVSCSSDLDFFYDVNRNSTSVAAERANVAASRRLVDDCRTASGRLLPHLSTRSTVRDMDAIRAAMGQSTIDYLGFSYGTYLGALYAQRYPHRVRAMVLDGAIDPAASYDAAISTQGVGFEHALDAFLAWCRDNDDCAFAKGGDPTTAFDDLMRSLTGESDPGTIDGEERSLGIGEANIGVATALYSGDNANGWVALGKALDDAANGDGSALLALSDAYTGRHTGGSYDNTTAAFYAIGCLDGPAPRTVGAVEKLAQRAARAAPNFGASTVWLGLPCTYWPVPPDGGPAPIHAPGAPPIVVIGNTNDPATPYSQAEALASELDSGRLLTYVGQGHTAYGHGHECIDDAVDTYLVTLKLPPVGTRCH
jgi:pimeloyl-ACP methyl ester carboxylesterase